jgi:hypothetical protein
MYDDVLWCLSVTFSGLAKVGHLKNVSPIFVQMPKRITNVEFTTVSPTIANTLLCGRLFFFQRFYSPTKYFFKNQEIAE